MGSLIAFIAGFVVVIGSIMSATDKPMAFIDIPEYYHCRRRYVRSLFHFL